MTLDELPAVLALEIDALCDDFERHWRRARRLALSPPPTECFLARATPELRPLLRSFLLELERELVSGVALPHIPGFTIEEEIGRGGMGVVYRARRNEHGRTVALKLIPGAEHARWSRWLRELAEVIHPHLVPLEAFGTHEGLHFVVMPLVSGGDLKERLGEFVLSPRAGRARRQAVAVLLGKVAGAVAYLHRRGILHRDLKPSNILLASAEDRHPLVCDFGLAGRLDEMDLGLPQVAGTLPYVAPEQLEGRPPSPAADIWSLGAVLHELLTGQPPAPGQEPEELSEKDDLQRICLRCLARDVSARYATADDLVEDLERQQNESQE